MFEWDPLKAAANLAKHGVSFEEATTAFQDARALDGPDIEHSTSEARRLHLGLSMSGRLLVVAYTVRRYDDEQEAIRIISARRASRKERRRYQTAQD
ncbi:MAG: BrnT family toxin [Nitrospirota bacterium]